MPSFLEVLAREQAAEARDLRNSLATAAMSAVLSIQDPKIQLPDASTVAGFSYEMADAMMEASK